MAQETLSSAYERARLSVRLGAVAFILTLILTFVVLIAGPLAHWAGIELFSLILYPFTAALFFSVFAIFFAVFERNALAEEEEKRLLQKRKENTNSLLDVGEDVRFTAKRTLDNFHKYVPSTVAVLSFLFSALALYLFWKGSSLGAADPAALSAMTPKNPSSLAFLSALLAVFAFFFGVFMVGQSHVREFRFLRPVGAWLILGGVVSALSTISALLIWYSKPGLNDFFAKIVFAVYVILTVEFLIDFVVEFYRPRTFDEVRPVYESRFLSLFVEPGGVVRNIADSLDYQFGFKVSKTWIYTFLQKSLIPALLLWGVIFWLFTSIAEVAPGERGVREVFGAANRAEILEPGVHLKWPWPIERIIRVPVDIVNYVTLGSEIDKSKAKDSAQVVLWSGKHYLKEDPFLVAMDSRQEAALKKNGNAKGAADQGYSVSILEVSIPVFYRARMDKIYEYAFGYAQLPDAILAIGQAEATRYFASTDFMKDISFGREEVAGNLKARIQKSCDAQELGVEIVCINMHDAHPPVGKASDDGGNDAPDNVAAAFQKVVCAEEEAKVMESEATAYQMTTEANAAVKSMYIIMEAEAYKNNKTQVAAQDAGRFEKQLAAFRQDKNMFKLRTYLDFLENDCKELRKFVISSQVKTRNYVLNLEEKPSLDLLDTDLTELGK